MTDSRIDIKVSSKVFNKKYLPYLKEEVRTQIFFGGSSAGKSVFLSDRTILDLLEGGRNYLAIRNTGVTLKTSIYNELCKTISRFNVSKLFNVNKSDMTITCVNGYQAILKGLDDVEKIKSIVPQKGVLTDIWIEEATETQEDDLKQLERRLRGESKKSKRIILSFNPIMKTHWIFKKYFAGRFYDDDKIYHDDRMLILKTIYKDNKFLSVDDKILLEEETDEYWYNVYTLGNWGVLGEVIFKNWKVEDIKPDLIRTFDNYKNGLDFGFSSDPAAFNRTHYNKKKKTIYILDELHEYGLTNPVLADLIKPLVGRETVVCDSAEPKSIQELREHGISTVGAKKGPDSVNFGIQWLQQQNIIVDRKCQETVNELTVYQWKKNRQGEVLRQPIDKDNHHIDNLRYQYEDEMPGRSRAGVWGKR